MRYRVITNRKFDNEIIEVAPNDGVEGCEFIKCEFVGCGNALFKDCLFSLCKNCQPGDLMRVVYEGCTVSGR